MKLLYGRMLTAVVAVMLAVAASAQTQWYNPMDADVPFLSGRGWNKEIGNKSFHRMPDRMEADMPKAVWSLSKNSAGESVKFLSNSRTVKVKYTLEGVGGFVNMAMLDHGGIDLYARDANGRQHWIGNHMGWSFGDTITITYSDIETKDFASRGLEYEVFLPPYSTVTSM
ncbi:MAG: acetylhydrolase, partial [Muribaculaceae bacterium]|nr:acetylhydrolase [Muribaculaceae bacterium]